MAVLKDLTSSPPSGGGDDNGKAPRASSRQRTRAESTMRLRKVYEEMFNKNAHDTAQALGFGGGSQVMGWLDGSIPFTKTADLACEALIRRMGTSLRATDTYVVTCAGGNLVTILLIVNALHGEVQWANVDIADSRVAPMKPVKADKEIVLVLKLPHSQVSVVMTVVSAQGGTSKQLI